ncbi:MAG: hypothetical protein ACM3SW_05570 [Actinomycetota bacterium]
MNSISKALLVVLLHIGIVLSLGGKLLYDRAYRPRVWVKTTSVDPNLPIRGRYLTLNLQVHAPDLSTGQQPKKGYGWVPVYLTVENNQLVAHRATGNTNLSITTWGRGAAQTASEAYSLSPPITFFLPEHAEGPLLRRGEELWAEVTIPRKGPPRPIQLAVKSGTQWKPLTYR